MVWENIEEIKNILHYLSEAHNLFSSAIFIFSNKVLGAFFFLREILPEQNFLID